MYTGSQTYSNNTARRGSQNDQASSAPYTSYQTQYPAQVTQPPMQMQPDLLAYNGQYGYGAGVHTPTSYDWNQQQGGAVYGPSTTAWTTSHTGANGSFRNASGSTVGSPAQQNLSQPDGGKKFRHNPYATSEPSSTPPQSPSMSASHSSTFGDQYQGGYAAGDPAAPVYDPNVFTGGNDIPHGLNMQSMQMHSLPPTSNNLEDQFNSLVGSIAQTACTARGRTLLLNIIRMQHLDKIQIIFEELCASFSIVIADPQGCHVLRFIVEYLQDSHIDTLCAIMTPDLAYSMCTLSQHSRRVLQCLVEHHKTARLQPLVELICANGQGIAIARTQQGCIAIMRMLENVVNPLKRFIFESIAPAFQELAKDQFGNYTVQTAIAVVDRFDLTPTFQNLSVEEFVATSRNKFGSNVMEKLVHAADIELVKRLVEKLCIHPDLTKLVNCAYGNFVVQGLVEVTSQCEDQLHSHQLCTTIRPMLQHSPYGHKIEAKLRSKRLLGPVANDSNVVRGHHNQGPQSCGTAITNNSLGKNDSSLRTNDRSSSGPSSSSCGASSSSTCGDH
jgi:hypothetical protein